MHNPHLRGGELYSTFMKGQDINFIWNSALIHVVLDYSWRQHELICSMGFDCSLHLFVVVIYLYQYGLMDIYFIILIITQYYTILLLKLFSLGY